jgi:hypothetical protein
MRAQGLFSISQSVGVLSLGLLLSGCSAWTAMHSLKRDALTEKGEGSTVLFGRVHIDDSIHTFGRSRENPSLDLLCPGKGPGEKTQYRLAMEGEWVQKEGVEHFEEVVFYEAKPGEYCIQAISYEPFHSTEVKGPQDENEPHLLEARPVFVIPVNRRCVIPSGGLIYLGVLEVTVTLTRRYETWQVGAEIPLKYDVKINQAEEELQKDLVVLKAKYPLLYGRLKDRMTQASWSSP